MKKFITLVSVFIFSVIIPTITFAVTPRAGFDGNPDSGAVGLSSSCDFGGLFGILCIIHQLLSNVIPVLVALGIVYLVWGVVTYVIADEAEAKSAGKDRMIFGIIGLAVIISVWGLVFILTDTFNSSGQSIESGELRGLVPR